MIARWRWALLAGVVAVGIGGCVPPTVAPHLDDTPGPAVIVTDERVFAGGLRIDRPAGWRVITSAADAPFLLIFAAPDDCGVLAISRRPVELPATSCPDTAWTDAVSIGVPTGTVYAAIRLPTAAPTPLWLGVINSLVEVDPDYVDPGS